MFLTCLLARPNDGNPVQIKDEVHTHSIPGSCGQECRHQILGFIIFMVYFYSFSEFLALNLFLDMIIAVGIYFSVDKMS